MYRVNGQPLEAIYDWVRSYEQLWTQRSTNWTSSWTR